MKDLAGAKDNAMVFGLLTAMAAALNFGPGVRRYLKGPDGWMDFSVGVKTRDGKVAKGIRFKKGVAIPTIGVPGDSECTLIYRDGAALKKMLDLPPEEVMNMLLRSELAIEGNLTTMSRFSFILSLLLRKKHLRMREAAKAGASGAAAKAGKPEAAPARRVEFLSAKRCDAVEYLDEPYLSRFSLDDFPRLKSFLDIHHTKKPEVCHERPLLMTRWFRENGFEAKKDGTPWVPELRQACALKALLENRAPMIRKNDLIPGTTTTKEIGVVLYPDTHGTTIWGELLSVSGRNLNPYDISRETIDILHSEVFPFWEKRNIREWTRRENNNPLCQQLDERFAVYFLWKTAALSHTIADYPRLLKIGTSGIRADLQARLKNIPQSEAGKRAALEAMSISLEGIEAYASNLSAQAKREADIEKDPARRTELLEIARICSKVPKYGAGTLYEAIVAVWIVWIGLHMENTNAGLSIGRLDQWLQPYFCADMAKIGEPAAREAFIRKAIELVGCFYMRCTDHLPLIPDIGNFLFGGSSSDQAITLGGTAPDGKTAVNDMTFIFLKVTEMLGIRDPNVNARFNPEVNSDAYLKRLCEVNLHTTSTPSMHNDIAVMKSIAEFGYPPEHIRDWSATGCVEPTISGRHIGHTNCMMMNMVAALEMALNNGRHPLMDWEVGPRTGSVEGGAFDTFEKFLDAFCRQYEFLIDRSCEYNNMLGIAHQHVRPTPFLSSLIDGCAEKGLDSTKGGARYNSSGAACIGLADVTDSLLAVKKAVYDERKVTLAELKAALDGNFAGHAELHAYLVNRVPKFGSGDPEALEMAKSVAAFSHDRFGEHKNYRGGRYTAGFWSMSNHVAFGCLSGALPSGRLSGKPFTPGLTPEPVAADNLLDPIRDVSSLPAEMMNNNIAFNIKVVPSPSDSHETAVSNIFSHVKTYFDLGGMQIQLNTVTSAVLRDAMEHPENHRNLMVRISGYNAYFVTLNRDMQMELIERAEYRV